MGDWSFRSFFQNNSFRTSALWLYVWNAIIALFSKLTDIDRVFE